MFCYQCVLSQDHIEQLVHRWMHSPAPGAPVYVSTAHPASNPLTEAVERVRNTYLIKFESWDEIHRQNEMAAGANPGGIPGRAPYIPPIYNQYPPAANPNQHIPAAQLHLNHG